MAIDGSRIQHITKEGLFYLDDEGKEVFIDLEAIHQRKIAKFLEPNSLSQFLGQARTAYDDDELEQAIEARKAIKDIGEWNFEDMEGGDLFVGRSIYIEIHTDPLTQFEFWWDSQIWIKFNRIEDELEQYGWILLGRR